MANEKHTPGPWKAVEFHTSDGRLEFWLRKEVDAGWGNLLNDEEDDNAEQNARLAAAGPELLESLQEMVHAFGWLNFDTGPEKDSSQLALDKAKQAISKALGNQ